MANLYEFFAGGGMARAGLGPAWHCLRANDFDPKKALSSATHWGGNHLHVGDVAALTTKYNAAITASAMAWPCWSFAF